MGFLKSRTLRIALLFGKYLDYIVEEKPSETVITKISDPVPGAKANMWQADMKLIINIMLDISKREGGWQEEKELKKILQKVKSKIEIDEEEWELLKDVYDDIEWDY